MLTAGHPLGLQLPLHVLHYTHPHGQAPAQTVKTTSSASRSYLPRTAFVLGKSRSLRYVADKNWRSRSYLAGLNLPLLTVDERLDVLLHVKWTVKEFDCDLTREIVELIDREADLLNRGRNPKVRDTS